MVTVLAMAFKNETEKQDFLNFVKTYYKTLKNDLGKTHYESTEKITYKKGYIDGYTQGYTAIIEEEKQKSFILQ